jgi:hypothetical protein
VKFLSKTSSRETLNSFRLAGDVYLLGSFEKGLTIYSQQVRALNLAWALIEAAPKNSLGRVAIVGGGFAGLTVAAGLLKKGVRHVSLFERHAVLCPLQQGSDARWVHPRIYEWPNEGSNLPTTALPLLCHCLIGMLAVLPTLWLKSLKSGISLGSRSGRAKKWTFI